MFLAFNVGDDISEKKDQSVLRRIYKRGEGWAKPSDESRVEVSLKGIYENRVFDERKLKFTISEGYLENIPEGFVVCGKSPPVYVYRMCFVVLNMLSHA